MAAIRGVLIDLSGTIHVDNSVIAGSIEALKRLRSTGLVIRFVTNTTKESKGSLLARLSALGFDIKAHELFTSLTATYHVLRKYNYRPFFLLEDDALRDFEGISVANPNAVVVGLSPSTLNYEPLNKAFRLLLDGCPLIAVHKARYYKQQDGLALGPGPFIAALEYAAGVNAEIVGKPAANFFKEALTDMGISPKNAVMIGDDVQGDIAGAQNIGMRGLLVRTGKYREGDETQATPPPESVCENFAMAVQYIEDMTQQ